MSVSVLEDTDLPKTCAAIAKAIGGVEISCNGAERRRMFEDLWGSMITLKMELFVDNAEEALGLIQSESFIGLLDLPTGVSILSIEEGI